MKKFDEVLAKRRQEVRQQRSRALMMQRKRMKKAQRIENTLNIVTLLLVLGLTAILVMLYIKIDDKDMKSCISAGNSKQYCERGLR